MFIRYGLSGDDVKILAISNVEGCAERIIDAFEDSDASIIAKEAKEDMEELSESVSSTMGKGMYDYAIVAVEDHVGATIEMNKCSNLRAALCDSEEDVQMAKRNRANVMIVRPSQKRFDFIVDGMSLPAKEAKKAPKNEKLFQPKKEEKPKREEAPEEDEEEEEYEDYQRSRGKGLVGRLKDSLGIVDKEDEKK